MNRRNFLKTVAGVVGAATVAAKLKPVPLMYDPAMLLPASSKVWQGINARDFPMLRAPVTDLNGPPLTLKAVEAVRSKMSELNAMQPMRRVIVGDGSGRIGFVLPEPLNGE